MLFRQNLVNQLVRYAWLSIALMLVLLTPATAFAQPGLLLIVEIKTKDARFAGTDDPVSISVGGIFQEELDDPAKDDRERGNTDRYVFPINDLRFTADWLRGAGTISIQKHSDSFWGGGWYFEGITIWLGSDAVPPIYQNGSVNRWLDGDSLSWSVEPDDPGWSLPDPVPPACTTAGDVDTGEGGSVDSDCDGIPDEDDPTFDPPSDSDGDGLPDRYEDLNGTDPDRADSDDDGWWDGAVNRRTALMLTKIEAVDEEEDLGKDEIYVTVEDVRFPSQTIWPMNHGTSMNTNIVVDMRVAGPAGALEYRSRIKLREEDLEIFEKPTDDTFADFDLEWNGEQGSFIKTLNGGGTLFDDFHYRLHFRWFTVTFADSQPQAGGGANADRDGDGLTDALEFAISTQRDTLRPTNVPRVSGYDGLADPEHRELFVELDAVGGDHEIAFDAKQMVASVFYHQGISPRFDDGYLGGGDTLPYVETIALSTDPNLIDLKSDLKPSNFWPQRMSFFRYGLFVDKLKGGFNGRADAGGVAGTDFIVARGTLFGQFAPIVFMHELGHTLSLCHPIGTKEPPSPSSVCPTPADWDGDPSTIVRECIHYCGVGDDDTTAMGDDIGWSAGGTIGGGLIGAVGGAAAGAGIGFLVAGPPGALVGALIGGGVGAIVGGAIGGFLGSDAYRRTVDYHPAEWAALKFW